MVLRSPLAAGPTKSIFGNTFSINSYSTTISSKIEHNVEFQKAHVFLAQNLADFENVNLVNKTAAKKASV